MNVTIKLKTSILYRINTTADIWLRLGSEKQKIMLKGKITVEVEIQTFVWVVRAPLTRRFERSLRASHNNVKGSTSE